jgi:hypothetical protein
MNILASEATQNDAMVVLIVVCVALLIFAALSDRR